MRNDFAVFILSNNRADSVTTLKTLYNSGYTGRYYIIIDNEDTSINKYIEKFGKEHIIVFDKLAKAKECDTFDNIDKRNTVLFARNSCHEIAKNLGLKYFLELDDDYIQFMSRKLNGNKLTHIDVKDMDSIIYEMLDFLDSSGALTVAFSQTGDFIGGAGSTIFREGILRKAMNAFFCKTDRPFKFIGRMNDDVNTYTLNGSQGKLFFTVKDVCLLQGATQQNSGGLTDMYLELGTYNKSFYTILCNPSSVYISEIGAGHKRIHHNIYWENTVPKIISDRFKIKE